MPGSKSKSRKYAPETKRGSMLLHTGSPDPGARISSPPAAAPANADSAARRSASAAARTLATSGSACPSAGVVSTAASGSSNRTARSSSSRNPANSRSVADGAAGAIHPTARPNIPATSSGSRRPVSSIANPSRVRSTARSNPTADTPPAASRIRSAAAAIAAWSSPHARACSVMPSSSGSSSMRAPHRRSMASSTLSRVDRRDTRVGDPRSSQRRSRRRCSRSSHRASYSRRRASSIATPSMRTGLRTKKPSRSYQVYSPRKPHRAAPPGPESRNCDRSSSTYCSRTAAFRSRCSSTRSMKRSSSLSSSWAPAGVGTAARRARRTRARHVFLQDRRVMQSSEPSIVMRQSCTVVPSGTPASSFRVCSLRTVDRHAPTMHGRLIGHQHPHSRSRCKERPIA